MIDHETLIDTLLRRDSTAASIGGEYDTTLERTLPALVYRLTGDGQVSNGPGLWTVELTANVHGEPADAWRVTSELYDLVHAWPFNSRIDGLGAVQQVDDEDMPTRQPTSPDGGNTGVQYTASWALLLREL
ncbi:hypothetical protein [Curtobacterium sp. Curtsp57]|uniref:hypothetical protein n=1 Tax=Curtobacterium sp. Curtsp57 TaxID=3243047 RepID=UPI0039B4727E